MANVKGSMNDRIDRILAVLDVGEQHTTAGHSGYPTRARPGDIDYEPSSEPTSRFVTASVSLEFSPIAQAPSVVRLPIQQVAAHVVMKPHQMRRDERRNGRTSKAAVRLVGYQCKRFMRDNDLVSVSDATLHVGQPDDFIRNQRTISAIVRCVDAIDSGLTEERPFRVPPDIYTVSVVRPRWSNLSHG